MLREMARACLRTLTPLLAAGLATITVATTAFADTTIRMWTFLDPAGHTNREKVFKDLIDGFEAAHPGVKIQVEPQIWQQLSDKFFAAHQTDTAPDVVWIHHSRIIDAIKLGSLANLDELFIKDWSPEQVADIDDALWRYGATPHAHYQILHARSTRGQYYRVDLFKKAGIDPASLTTWDKFIAAAQKVTEKDASGNVIRWGYGQSFPTEGSNAPVMHNVLLDLQGYVFDPKGQPVWSTPAGVKGLNLELDMIRKYGVTPETAISMKDDDTYEQFNGGRMAMIRGGTARFSQAMAALGPDKVGYLRTPSFTEGKYSPTEVVGWAMGVWSGSKNKELAGKWVEYMSDAAADKLWVMKAGAIPIHKSTITNNPEFFSRPENQYLVTAAKEMETGWLPPEGVAAGYNDDLNRAAQDVFINGTDTQEALRKAEAAFSRRQQ